QRQAGAREHGGVERHGGAEPLHCLDAHPFTFPSTAVVLGASWPCGSTWPCWGPASTRTLALGRSAGEGGAAPFVRTSARVVTSLASSAMTWLNEVTQCLP